MDALGKRLKLRDAMEYSPTSTTQIRVGQLRVRSAMTPVGEPRFPRWNEVLPGKNDELLLLEE